MGEGCSPGAGVQLQVPAVSGADPREVGPFGKHLMTQSQKTLSSSSMAT